MVKLKSQSRKKAIQVERKSYSATEAIELMKERSQAKFVETAEVHISLNLNPKYADQQLRANVILPKGLGKIINIAVIARGEKVSEALNAGATIAGAEDLINDISSGSLSFDKLIATPDTMPLIAKLGRVLGPRGLMPSPKAGTVTTDVTTAIEDFKRGKIEYKVDKTGVVHSSFGKVNFTVEDLVLNLKALLMSIYKNRPSGSKGKFWKNVYICSTMGPSIEIDFIHLIM